MVRAINTVQRIINATTVQQEHSIAMVLTPVKQRVQHVRLHLRHVPLTAFKAFAKIAIRKAAQDHMLQDIALVQVIFSVV